jgi:uncharacterized membrane protein
VEILVGLIVALVVLAIPFVVPIVAWVSARNLRHRLNALETLVREQRSDIDLLISQLRALRSDVPRAADVPPLTVHPAATVAEAQPAPPPAPVVETETAPIVPPVVETQPPRAPPGLPREAWEEPWPATVRGSDLDEEPEPESEPDVTPEELPADERGAAAPPPPTPPPPPAPMRPAFDWESVVGVKLFSAIAGIALVIAAVFFLRHSIESGWLQPPVRMAIGIIVAVVLLVACELKAARRYPATANALDAAAIAILFSTFFAAHALWDLIPASVTFALLTLVTAVAVLLSIRRESLFIAVLGLLGGFATPALLSTGENRPIPLFAYLLLLNVGLAWVAYKRVWPVLTWLTLIFTTFYQWGWVIKYLDTSALPLALGVFILFPVVSIAALLLSRTPADSSGSEDGSPAFNRAALISAGLPVLFGLYLATVPEYGARPALLFGFMLLIDLGFLAIAIARRQELLHATGAVATMLTVAVWLTTSYSPDSRYVVLSFTAAFALLYAFAAAAANMFRRPFEHAGTSTPLAGPLLLFVFAVVAGQDAAIDTPWPMFILLLALVLAIAARAIAARQGSLYFVAAFFAVATQANWSAEHLTIERLGTAVGIYAVFGLVALAVPIAGRRLQRPLEPPWGGGVVLLSSLLLLLFISAGSVAPAALWALALLLAILNAALFVESAAGRLPLLSQVGSILSWIVLATWWGRAAGSVGVIPSLTVLTGLGLVTLAGHAWSFSSTRQDRTIHAPLTFSNGLYLALGAHLFLAFLALNREWALPPWPLFGSLAVLSLATSAASLVTRTMALHAAGVVASALVIAAWSSAAGAAPYGSIAVAASVAVTVYALVWIGLTPREKAPIAGIAVAGSVLVGEVSVLAAVAGGGAPPFGVVLAVHAASVVCLLWLSARFGWGVLPIVATAPAWLAVLQSMYRLDIDASWQQLLLVASVLYAVFAAYPLILGGRARTRREPYVAALIASAMFFVGARAAFVAGDLEWMIGVVPVAAGAVLALLLRQLVAIQPEGERDTGSLALVAGGALAFVTVAIPLQLEHQWITIGWALEGAAMAWLYRRIPHRGLLYAAAGLLAIVFARLALNPEVLLYEPRGATRIFNWYLYTYVIAAAAMIAAGWWLSKTNDRLAAMLPRPSQLLPAGGVILLFVLLNIEIADFYATGPTVTFRFGVTVSQDLTYTIGWLAFGMVLLAAGIYLKQRPARIAAVSLIAVTTFKCFLYDLGSLGGLYRVASFVGLAMSLALVSVALQKFVLSKPRETV